MKNSGKAAVKSRESQLRERKEIEDKQQPSATGQDLRSQKRKKAIAGILFTALFIFTSLCLVYPAGAGLVGKGVKTALSWSLGIGRFAVPILFLLCAIGFFSGKSDFQMSWVVLGVLIIFIAILAILQTGLPAADMFKSSRLSAGGGGGLAGSIFAWPLVKTVGRIGSYIFLTAALIAGIVIAFEEQLSQAHKRFFESSREKSATPVANVAVGQVDEKSENSRKSSKKETVKYFPSAPSPPVEIAEDTKGQLAIKVSAPHSGKYKLPPTSILNRTKDKAFSQKTNDERKRAIEQTLKSMDVDARVVNVHKGPTVSLFEVEVGTGEKVRRVTELEQDIAYALGSPDIRIYSPIPGKQAIGIEVPNHIRDTVLLGDIIDRIEPPAPHNLLTVGIGKNMSGEPVILDLAQLPHLLLAGSTGAGKSCCINCLVCCLLFRCRPDQLKLIMIDPKFVEFTWYKELPHLLCDVINEPEPASKALLWAVEEMDRRYQELQRKKVVHIDEYNALVSRDGSAKPMSKIVIVIDELGDLMAVARKEVETSISRLTAKARAVGIHMILATQRPSVDVITGVIKNNITARIAFQVASNADSRTILGTKGAEKLLGKGDMLLDPGNLPQPIRVQGALIQHKEIELLTGYIKEQRVPRDEVIDLSYDISSMKDEMMLKDPLLSEAARIVVNAGEASASMLQTLLHVGYARARRLIVELSELGIVGPHEGSKSRKVLITPEELDEWISRQNGRLSSNAGK